MCFMLWPNRCVSFRSSLTNSHSSFHWLNNVCPKNSELATYSRRTRLVWYFACGVTIQFNSKLISIISGAKVAFGISCEDFPKSYIGALDIV